MSRLGRLFENYRDQITDGSENSLFAVPALPGPFSVYPPAPDYPGFRICGHLNSEGIDAVCEVLSGRPDADAIRERLESEEASACCIMAQDWIDDNEEAIPCDILSELSKAAEIGDEQRRMTAVSEIVKSLPDGLLNDFWEKHDQRIAEEGIFCLDVGVRSGTLSGKISFAPYYDFNYPLFEEKAEGEKACRKVMRREFPAVSPDEEDRPSFRM